MPTYTSAIYNLIKAVNQKYLDNQSTFISLGCGGLYFNHAPSSTSYPVIVYDINLAQKSYTMNLETDLDDVTLTFITYFNPNQKAQALELSAYIEYLYHFGCLSFEDSDFQNLCLTKIDESIIYDGEDDKIWSITDNYKVVIQRGDAGIEKPCCSEPFVSKYLKLDTSNDPLTGNLEISTSSPTLTLTKSTDNATVSFDGDALNLNASNVKANNLTSDGFVKTINGDGTLSVYTGSVGVTDHSLLTNLDYASAGHTGFEPTLVKGDITADAPISIIGGANASTNASGVNITIDLSNYLTNVAGQQHSTLSELEWSNCGHTINTTVDFDDNDLINVGHIDFDLNHAQDAQEGRMLWNSDDGTISIGMPGGNVTLQVGQEQLVRCYNNSGVNILNGDAVIEFGSHANRPSIKKALATVDDTILGLATEDIDDGHYGYVNIQGLVRGLNTVGFSEGDILYLSDVTDGLVVNTMPTAPNYVVKVGECLVSDGSNGVILVSIRSARKLTDLSDVDGTPLTATGQLMVWNNSAGYFDFDKNINDYLTESNASSIYLTQTNAASTYETIANVFSHTSNAAIHFLESEINHENILNIGNNSHADIDTALIRLADTSGVNTGDQDLSPYLTEANAASYYLQLNCANDPLTASLEISTNAAEIRLTDNINSYYSRIYRTDTTTLLKAESLRPPSGGDYAAYNPTRNAANYALKTSPSGLPTGKSNISVSFWFKKIDDAANIFWYGSSDTIGASNSGIYLGYISGSWRWTPIYNAQYVAASPGGALDTNWHNLILIYNASTNTAMSYYDGAYVGENTNWNSINISATYLGIYYRGLYNGSGRGSIDELAVFNKVLDSTEIAREYNSGSGWLHDGAEAGIVGLWHFNEGSGTTYDDAVGSNHMTLAGATTWTTGYVSPSYAKFENEIIKVENGDVYPYKGIVTFGADDTKTKINGVHTCFLNNGTEKFCIDDSGDLVFPDDYKVYFGTGKEASIVYDSTDLIINTQESGTGDLRISHLTDNGFVKTQGGDGTLYIANGVSGTYFFDCVSAGNVTSITITDGLITGVTTL